DALAVELGHRCRVRSQPASGHRPNLPAPRLANAGQPLPRDAAALRKLGEDVRAVYEEGQATPSGPAEVQEEPDQPPARQVICKFRAGGVTLMVPPGGVGPFFLLGFGLCVFAALPTLASLVSGFRTADGSYGPLLMVIVLWAIALAV